MTNDAKVKSALAALFAAGLALILWPVYAALHRNGRVRLEGKAK
jgi:hypothetical protein